MTYFDNDSFEITDSELESYRAYILNLSNHELMEIMDVLLRETSNTVIFNVLHDIQLHYADNHHYRTTLDLVLNLVQKNHRELALNLLFHETTRRFQDNMNQASRREANAAH